MTPDNFVIVGAGSDIAKELKRRLEWDGWQQNVGEKWDLLILARGTLEPIGRFVDCDAQDWVDSVSVNALNPLMDFRAWYPSRNEGATVVFFGGTNPQKTPATYSAYASAKAMLREAVKIIDSECSDINVVMIDPGLVRTKIHEATMRAGTRAANYADIENVYNGKCKTVSHDEVYEKLKAHIGQRAACV